MTRDISIPSTGAPVAVPLGVFKYFAIRRANVPFQISFDGWNWAPAWQNHQWDKSTSDPLPEKVYFMAANGLAADITIAWDIKPMGAQDTAQSTVTTSAQGCGGAGIAITLQKAIAVGGADYVYNAGNRVNLAAANSVLLIPGIVNGQKRKSIYFDNRNSAQDCVIFDSDGNLWQYLKTGKDTPVFETSSDFYAAGMGGVCANFLFAETFYDLSNS